MKNLKRFLSVLVVVAMMVTAMVPASFAAAGFSYEKEATTLNTLGLYAGIVPAPGPFTPDLGTALDRQTGVSMIVKLFGLEKDAVAMSAADVTTELAKFKDAASIADWAKPYIAYAAKTSLVVGNANGTFGPKDGLVGKAYATMVLRKLGYTVDASNYDAATGTLADKGGLTASQAFTFANKSLIKDDLVGISFGSLKAVNKDGKTLAQALVDAKVITLEQAAAAGLIKPVTLESLAAVAGVTIKVGETAKLPEKVSATYSDGTKSDVAVTWGAVDNTKAGKVTVAGTVAGTDKKASVEVTVVGIKSVANPADVAMFVGDDVTKTLPAKVTATYDDASTAEVDVTWAKVDTTTAMAKTAVEGTIANTTVKASINVTINYVVPVFSGVTAANYRELDLAFNKALDKDSAQDKANYSVNNGGTIVVDKAVLLEDGKTVRLTLQSNPGVQVETKVKVLKEKIKDVDGLKIAENTIKISPFDSTIPVLEKVEQVGNDRIKLTFSEPVYGGGFNKILLDNGTRSINQVIINAGTIAPSRTFETTTVSLANGKHTLKVSGYKDFADFVMQETTLEFDYAKVSGAPEVTVKSANENSVTLSFARPVTIKAGMWDSGVKVYHTIIDSDSYKATSMAGVADTKVTVNSKDYYTEYKVSFTAPILTGTATNLFLKTNLSGNKDCIEDEYGNDVATITLPFTSSTDNVKPTATVEATNDKTIVVKFDEAVKTVTSVVDSNWANSAMNPNNYTLLDPAGAVVNNDINKAFDAYGHPANATITSSTDAKTITISLGANILSGSNYSLKIEKIKDNAFYANTMDAATIPFTVSDKTNPTIVSAVVNADKDKVRLTFSEPMAEANLTDAANYYYKLDAGAPQALPEGSTVTILSSKTVLITFAEMEDALKQADFKAKFGVYGLDGNNDIIAATKDYVVALSNLTDLAGNRLGGVWTTEEGFVKTEGINVIAGKTKVTSATTLKFDVDTELSAIDLAGFSIQWVSGSTNKRVDPIGISYENHNGTATVTMTLKDENNFRYDARMGNFGGCLARIADNAMTSVYGTKNTLTPEIRVTTYPNGGRVEDGIAPGFDNTQSGSLDTDADGKIDHIYLQFSEPMDPATFSKDKFTVTGGGYTYEIIDAFLVGDYDGGRTYSGGKFFGSVSNISKWDSNFNTPAVGAGTDGSVAKNGGTRPASPSLVNSVVVYGQIVPVAGQYGYLTVKERTDVTYDNNVKVNLQIAAGIKDLAGNEKSTQSVDLQDRAFPVLTDAKLSSNNSVITLTLNEKVKPTINANNVQISRDGGTTWSVLAGATISYPADGQVAIATSDLSAVSMNSVMIRIVAAGTGSAATWHSDDDKAFQMVDITTGAMDINIGAAPMLIVSAASDNANKAIANETNSITLTMVANEDLVTAPIVKIGGLTATVANTDAKHYTATISAAQVATLNNGPVGYNISGYADGDVPTPNVGATLTSTNCGVTVDKSPVATVTYGVAGPYTAGDSVTIIVAMSEATTVAPTISIALAGVAPVSDAALTLLPGTTNVYSYTYDTTGATAGAGAVVTINGVDATGNNVVTSNGTFAIAP